MTAGPSVLPLVSSIIGWTYFGCWSISLYPAVLLSRRTRSVEGVSVDFVLLNVIGYAAYTVSLTLLYFNQQVRDEYAQRHKSPVDGTLNYPLVRFNDVCYGLHGTLLVAYSVYQVFSRKYKKHASQRVSKLLKIILVAGFLGFGIMTMYAIEIMNSPKHYELLDVATLLGKLKVVMSCAKYVPQVIHNYRRRSTQGWSIGSVQLDMIGGMLALAQLFLDGYIRNDLNGVWNNSVKLLLSAITLGFDVIFIIQHYILYPHSSASSSTSLPSMSSGIEMDSK